MSLPMIPVIASIVVGIGISAKHYFKKTRGMTIERQRIYDAALSSLKPAAKLRFLAEAFRAEGLKTQAELLEKRAALKELPGIVRVQRRNLLKEILTWTDPVKIRRMAAVYDEVGSTGAAALLRRYAAGLPKQLPAIVQSTIETIRRRQNQGEGHEPYPIDTEFDQPIEESNDIEAQAVESMSTTEPNLRHDLEEIEKTRTELEIEAIDPIHSESNSGITSPILPPNSGISEPSVNLRQS